MSTRVLHTGTPLLPLVTEESKKFFVDESIKPFEDVSYEGVEIKTGFLKFGEELSLLGISQNAALIAAGIVDPTDTLDPQLILDKILFKNGTVVDASGMVDSAFLFNVPGNYRVMKLDANPKDIDHKAFHVFGQANLETSDLLVEVRELENFKLASQPVGFKLRAVRAQIKPLSSAV